jgi:hypothetical protein
MRLLLLSIFLFSSLFAKSGILEVKWSEANTKYQKPSIPYPTVLTKGIAHTQLPVYLPSTYLYDKNMAVVSNRNFYTISFILDGATLMIAGDKTYQESVSPNDPKFQALIDNASTIEFMQEEGMMNSDFNRHGVNYSLLVECDAPKTDKRCLEENFLRNIYTRLILVGGER